MPRPPARGNARAQTAGQGSAPHPRHPPPIHLPMPRCHHAPMPRCHDATMPRCHDATMPRCPPRPTTAPPVKPRVASEPRRRRAALSRPRPPTTPDCHHPLPLFSAQPTCGDARPGASAVKPATPSLSHPPSRNLPQSDTVAEPTSKRHPRGTHPRRTHRQAITHCNHSKLLLHHRLLPQPPQIGIHVLRLHRPLPKLTLQ